MNDTESHADVVAEMQYATELAGRLTGGYGDIAATYVKDWIDRITAAHEREMAQKDAEVERLQDEIDNKWASGVHTCGTHCQRPMCVQRREIETTEAELVRLRVDAAWLRSQMRHGPLDHSFIKDEKACDVCKRLNAIDALATQEPKT